MHHLAMLGTLIMGVLAKVPGGLQTQPTTCFFVAVNDVNDMKICIVPPIQPEVSRSEG